MTATGNAARRPSRRHDERGVTLVELMIAMTLALLVLSVVATLVEGTSRNRSSLERSSRLAENVGYAIELLTQDLRMAGYYAETNFVGVAWQSPDPCATGPGGQGWSAAPFTAPVPLAGYRSTDIPPDCIRVGGSWIPGTGVVVIRRVDVETTPVASVVGVPFLQVSKCNADPVFWVYSDKKADFTLRNLDCATAADIRQAVVRSYFVSRCDECGVDSTPTLKRAELTAAGITITPLVEGIENLQLQYGFDTNGDGNADVFLPGRSGTVGAADDDWSNVVAVRVYVLARSGDAEPGYANAAKQVDLGPLGLVTVPDDGMKRVAMSATVRLNNPSMQRETP